MSNGSMLNKIPGVKIGEVEQLLQELRSEILEDVDNKLQRNIDVVVSEIETKHRKLQNGFIEKSSLTKSTGKPKELPPKEFVVRNSTLTNLSENVHFRSVRHICLSIFVLLYLYIAIFYYFNVHRLKRHLAMVVWTWGKLRIVTAIWFAINLSIVFMLYPIFRFWATSRLFVKQKYLYDSLFCVLFILYETALIMIPAWIIIVYNIPPVSSFIVLTEQSRLFMKTYAFVRENIIRALNYKPHQDGDKEDSNSGPCPKVDKLIYFLFAPTLVYRDNYPRSSHVRWSYVAWNFLQKFLCAMAAYIFFSFFVVDTFENTGKTPVPLVSFVVTLAMSVPAGGILMLIFFYGHLHVWLNAFGEMLKFGDRMFYDDWWNCTSFGRYYRSWNMVVYDWLYSYIYRDAYVVLGKSRTGAMFTVFFISAVVHEYILALCFKFLFPALFIFFSIAGVPLVLISRRQTSAFWNVFIWGAVILGWGLLTVIYSSEWYARVNCPRTLDSWLDYVFPRSFQCNIISLPL